jgi:hypothetical protein
MRAIPAHTARLSIKARVVRSTWRGDPDHSFVRAEFKRPRDHVAAPIGFWRNDGRRALHR